MWVVHQNTHDVKKTFYSLQTKQYMQLHHLIKKWLHFDEILIIGYTKSCQMINFSAANDIQIQPDNFTISVNKDVFFELYSYLATSSNNEAHSLHKFNITLN